MLNGIFSVLTPHSRVHDNIQSKQGNPHLSYNLTFHFLQQNPEKYTAFLKN